MTELYLFNKEEVLINIIPEDDFNNDSHVRELNSKWSFEFTTTFQYLNDLSKSNKVGFYDRYREFRLFKIIKEPEVDYLSNEVVVNCLNDCYEMSDQIIEDKRLRDGTARQALDKVLEGSSYEVGEVAELGNRTINFYDISRMEGLNNIIESYGGELDYRIEFDADFKRISHKYVDIKSRLGQDTGLRFTYDLNLESVVRKDVSESHCTVLYGRGGAIESGDGYSRKIKFTDVEWKKPTNPIDKPIGQTYIEDLDAIAKYGRIEGIYENSDIEEPGELLQATYEALQECKNPKLSYEVNAKDLASQNSDYDHLTVVLGDSVILLDEDYDLNLESRIVGFEESIKEESAEMKWIIGNVQSSFSSDNASSGQIIKPSTGDVDIEIDDDKFPDALPDVPIIEAEGLFGSVIISWTYESKSYYEYELYASKLESFNPDASNLIFRGKASSYHHQVKPSETWYYRARAINTHGRTTDFSSQVKASTLKIEDGTEYFEKAAIADALIGELRLDRGWVGQLRGNWIDAKQLSVTDGNGKRTLDIDSFGNVNLDVTSLKIKNNSVATESFVSNAKNDAINSANNNTTIALENHYTKSETDSKISVAKDEINLGVSNTYETKTNVETKVASTLNSAKSYSDTKKTEAINAASTDATNKVNSAKTELNTAIGKKANSVDVYTKSEVYTKAQTDSAIKVAKDEINLGVSGTYETKTNVETKVSSTLNSAKSYADAKKTEAINTASTDATNKVNSAKTELNTAINKKANSADVYTKTQVYTKDETNSQINIAKEAINLGVSNTYETKANVTTKVSNAVVEARRITDTRNTNQNPQWYMANYPKQTISEFKSAIVIGIPNASANYGALITNTPWGDASGGYPVQTFKSSDYKTYERRGTSLTNWGGWVQIENAIDSQIKANTAKQEAITSANNTLTTTIANYYTKTQTDSQINVAKNAITQSVSSTYETKTDSTTKYNTATAIAKAMNNGKIIHEDIAFRKGGNNVNLYNNAGNGNVKVERITKPSDCPTTSTHCIRVTTTGTASPGWGGFQQNISSRANAVFIQKIVAKLPSGYQLNVASNSMGTGYTDKWLTSNKGTGKWETYIRQTICGSTGKFSTGGHIYASGGATPTTSNPLVWYIGSCTVIDITDTDERVSSLTTRMSTAESKITDTAITNTVKKNFYTKEETNNQITSKGYQTASQVQQTVNNLQIKFTESGGCNLLRNGGFENGMAFWSRNLNPEVIENQSWQNYNGKSILIRATARGCGIYQFFSTVPGKIYSYSFYAQAEHGPWWAGVENLHTQNIEVSPNNWRRYTGTFTATNNSHAFICYAHDNGRNVFLDNVIICEGSIPSAYTPHPSEIYDGLTQIDKEGITVTASNVRSKTKMSADGFQLIRTTDNKKMFYVNQDGSLEMSGNFTQYDTNGKMSIKIANNSYGCYDWLWDGDFVGNFGAFESNRTNTSGANQRFIGIANIADYGNQLVLGVRSSPNSTNFNTYMEIDNTGIMHRDYVTFTANTGFKTNAIFRNPSNNNETGRIFGATNDHFFVACNYHNQLRLGYEKNGTYYSAMSIYRNDNTGAGCAIEYYADEVHHNNVLIEGFLSVKGQKNRLVATENFGDRLLNAYETAECYFGDINEAVIGEDGEVKVELDEVFLETVNTTEAYQVFLAKYGEGDCYVSERHEKYFVIKGTPNLSVGFEVKAKQRGYEKERLKMTVDTLKSHQAMSYSPCSEDEAGYTIDCETTINRA